MKHSALLILPLLLAVATVFSGCSGSQIPKPYGYYRIALPKQDYKTFSQEGFPYTFEISTAAEVVDRAMAGENYWIDIVYPTLNAKIHCSYKPVNGNLRQLSDDAQEFVYDHAGMASSIPEQGYENAENRVYGVYYELKGNTASPCQFYLTDSTRNFFRGAVYFNCIPNQDSLAPVIDFVSTDVRHLVETLRWK